MITAESPVEASRGGKGYLLYCPCMGRLGNQVSQLLGSLEVAKASGRTLVLPPFIDYKRGETIFEPFGEIFRVEAVRELLPVVTMDEFLSRPDIDEIWPSAERRIYCPEREGETGCRMPSGNPHETFWDHFGIEFSGSVAEGVSSAELIQKLSADEHPVIALGSAPGRFPVEPHNRSLQRHLVWSDPIHESSEAFIAENLPRPFLAVHLRTHDDWKNACDVDGDGPTLPQMMASPQCGLAWPKPGTETTNVPQRVCYPDPDEVVRSLKMAREQFGEFRTVFIGTDRLDYREAIEAAVGEDVKVVRGASPTLDLYVFTRADYFLANCVSSFSALAVRERRVHGRPTAFFGFDEWTADNAYLGESIAFDLAEEMP